jgi:hypothetical protein
MENLMQRKANRANGSLSHPNHTPSTANLTALRTAIEGLLAMSEYVTDLEYQTAAQRVAACQSVAVLQKWYRNCVREIARREEEQLAPVVCAAAAQHHEIVTLLNHVTITRQEKIEALLNIQQLDGAQAVALIGNLYQRILDRTGKSLARHAVAMPASAPATNHPAR